MIKISFFNPRTKQKYISQVVRPIVIGRSVDCDIQITWENTVSLYHTVVIPRKDGRIEVRDLASSAGTYVSLFGQKKRLLAVDSPDGHKAGRATIYEGDSFYLGLVKIEVEREDVPGDLTIDGEDITGRVDLADVEEK
jgi:pSer/pThr/pTyr-binding forkhead associated (FHA) protein